MRSRPRILLVVHSALIGGAQLMTLAAAERLAQRYELHIMIPNGPLRSRFAAYGTIVRSSPRMPYGSSLSWRWGLQALRSQLDAVRVAAYIRRHRISAAYVNTTVTLGPVIGAKLASVPVLVHARELPPDHATQALFAVHAALADTVIPASDAVDRSFRWCRRARFKRIYDGVEIPARRAPAAAFNTPLRLVLVGTVGGGGRKGQDIAIAALAELIESGVPAHLELVGAILDEASAHQLRAQATALGVGASVVVTGPTDLVRQHMGDADILLSCARQEPLGLTIIEALGMELPGHRFGRRRCPGDHPEWQDGPAGAGRGRKGGR